MKTVTNSRTLRALSARARTAGFIVAVAFAGLFMTACKDEGPRTVASITISPTTATLTPTGTQQFTAVVLDNNGDVLNNTPTWAIVSGGGTITQTGLFTAGTTPGTTVISVTCRSITATATITVNAGPAATIVVAPDTTLLVGATAQFRAVVRDAFGNVLTIAPVWSTANPPGTIVATTGFFTAGNTVGSFPNSVQACIPSTTICDQANVIVISPPAPPPVGGGFTVLGRAAVTCSLGSITPGDVGTFQAAGDAPPGSITPSCIAVTSPGTVHAPGDAATKTAYNNFLTAYTARAPQPGDCDATHTLTGSLAGVTLTPGVYCFSAAAALTGTLTLSGNSTGIWLFKIGTTGTGGLTGTNFTVIMAGGALPCNVTWWVRQAATMTDSFLKGTVMAGTDVTVTNGTFGGNMWAGASGAGDATETGAAVTGCP
jgi:hypothetical protein